MELSEEEVKEFKGVRPAADHARSTRGSAVFALVPLSPLRVVCVHSLAHTDAGMATAQVFDLVDRDGGGSIDCGETPTATTQIY